MSDYEEDEDWREALNKYDYVVVDGNTNEIVCENCGERQKLKMPMSIDIFSRVCRFFIDSHKGCINVNKLVKNIKEQ